MLEWVTSILGLGSIACCIFSNALKYAFEKCKWIGEYGTKCKFQLFSSLMVYHLIHTLKILFLLIGESGNQHTKFTWIIYEYFIFIF